MYISALKAGDMTVSKPGLVEGFLPISALMSLKRLVLSGQYDFIHPAGLTLFIFAILISVLFKKSFCSHICPVGLVSETLSDLGKKLRIHKWIFHPLTIVKYGILGFFGYMILVQMSVRSIEMFLRAPYNMVADAKMMNFFVAPSKTTIIVLAVILVLTLIAKNVWCRLLCPYGALLGLLSVASPFKVKRNEHSCINCGKCERVCPNAIEVYKKNTVHTPECMGCFECVNNRTVDDCLEVTGKLQPKQISLAVAGILVLTITAAMAFGYWESNVTNEQYKHFLSIINKLSH
jgi:polyferredoxin